MFLFKASILECNALIPLLNPRFEHVVQIILFQHLQFPFQSLNACFNQQEMPAADNFLQFWKKPEVARYQTWTVGLMLSLGRKLETT
jgi:hypothetical protein